MKCSRRFSNQYQHFQNWSRAELILFVLGCRKVFLGLLYEVATSMSTLVEAHFRSHWRRPKSNAVFSLSRDNSKDYDGQCEGLPEKRSEESTFF